MLILHKITSCSLEPKKPLVLDGDTTKKKNLLITRIERVLFALLLGYKCDALPLGQISRTGSGALDMSE